MVESFAIETNIVFLMLVIASAVEFELNYYFIKI